MEPLIELVANQYRIMQHSKGGISFEYCDNMGQSEYEMHMYLISTWEDARNESVKKLAEKGLPGMMMAMLYYGKG